MPCPLRQCSPAGVRNKVTGGIRGCRAMDICHYRLQWSSYPHLKENAPERWVRLQIDYEVEAGRQEFAFLLLVFVFPLTMFHRLLRFRFFHGLLCSGRSLGADFGAFLTLFFPQLLPAQQFDEGFFSSIALLPT